MVNKIKKIILKRDGMSIVSVIVGFTVMLILVAMFTGVVLLTQNVLKKADNIRDELKEIEYAYSLGKANDTDMTGLVNLKLQYKTDSINLKTSLHCYSCEDNNIKLYSIGKHQVITDQN